MAQTFLSAAQRVVSAWLQLTTPPFCFVLGGAPRTQTSNPHDDWQNGRTQQATDYTPVDVTYTGNSRRFFQGMGFSGRGCLMDGQPNSNSYHFAVAAYGAYCGMGTIRPSFLFRTFGVLVQG